MERAIEIFAIINFAIVGISHTIAPRAWVAFFTRVRDLGESGILAIAFPALIFGSLVVAFHNVWAGIPIVLTLLGWAHVVKSLVYFAFPSFALKQMRVSDARGTPYVLAGVALLLVAGALGYHVVTAS